MSDLLLFLYIHLTLITLITFPIVMMVFRSLYAKYDMLARKGYDKQKMLAVTFTPLNIGLLLYYQNRKKLSQYTVNEDARKTRSAVVIWFKRTLFVYGLSLLIMTAVMAYLVYTS